MTQPTAQAKLASDALDALFQEDAWPEQGLSALDVHLAMRHDPALRARFDALALAARQLQPDPSAPSALELTFLTQSLSQALDAQLAQEAHDPHDAPGDDAHGDDAPGDDATQTPSARLLPWPRAAKASALAAAACAALGLAALLRGPQRLEPQPPDPSFAARSASDEHAERAIQGATPHARLHLFCLTGPPDAITITSADDAPFGALSCPLDGQLKLAASNPSQQPLYIAAFSIGPQGQARWYGPSPADPQPRQVHAHVPHDLPAPLGESIHLRVNHSLGLLTVYALSSPSPLDHATLQAWLKAQPAQAWADGQPKLPQGVALSSATLEIVEAAP